MTDEPNVPVLILAAGASRRMRGGDKLLEQVEGQPLLRLLACRALASGAPVLVTLPPDRPARAAVLDGLPVQLVEVADAGDGMAASLRGGVTALGTGACGVLVLLGDMPDITTADMALMLKRFRVEGPHRIWRGAAKDGTPGHPVLFHRALFSELTALQGDEGARKVLARHADAVQPVPLPGRRALVDLDTPEAWAAWRATRGDQSM